MRHVAGKRALITGAASGIGRALAVQMAQAECDLYLLDVNLNGLEHTARLAEEHGVQVVCRQCDISRKQDVAASVQQAIDAWAGVDILINNAGVTYYGITHAAPEEEWDRLLAINLTGAMDLTRRLLPWMLARPEAHILNMCSVLGLVGLPRVSLYATSKFAMVGFSESLRAEYTRQGLGVTAMCPGFVRTNLFRAARPMGENEAPREPPRLMCTSPERVARKAVRAIHRNKRLVVMEPFARIIRAAKVFAPGLLDWAMRLGERRKIAAKRHRLDALSNDPTEALRLAVDAPHQRKAA